MSQFLLNKDLNKKGLLRIGDKAPDFTLKTEKGEDWRLSDHIGNVVALLFYPKDETLVCTKQLCSVRDNWKDYLETKAEIVAISPGTTSEHKEFGRKYKLPLRLLADEDRKVTNAYSFHWIFPTIFTRAIVVIGADGHIRTRRVMLRAFRPMDRSVITAIYKARGDALQTQYKSMTRKNKDEFTRRNTKFNK